MPTPQEIQDAGPDLQTLEDVANGSATINGTGLVPTRLGGNVKTLRKVILDAEEFLAEQDIGDGAAALINQRVDRVAQGLDEVNRVPADTLVSVRALSAPSLRVSDVGNVTAAFGTDGSFWERPEYTTTLDKYRNSSGAEGSAGGLKYLTYTLTGDETEIRVWGRAGTGTAPLAVLMDGASLIGAVENALADVAQFYDYTIQPAGATTLYVNSTSYDTVDIQIRREGAADLVRVKTDAWGKGPQPYVVRPTVNRPLVLDTASVIEAHLSHGQSWRADALAIPLNMFLERIGDGRALTMQQDQAGTALPTIGIDFFATIATDFFNLNTAMSSNGTANQGANVGRIAAQCLAMFRDRFRNLQVPLLDICGAYPGQPIGPLLPGGSVTAGAETYHPWATLLAYIDKARTIATLYDKTVRIKSFAWTHGDSTGYADYYDGLTAVLAAVDAADFNGDGSILPFFMDQKAMETSETEVDAATLRQLDFANDNYTRVFLYGNRAHLPMRDEIHHTALGIIMQGEEEAYVKHLVLDRALEFAANIPPYVWRPSRITNVTIAGNTVTATVSAPQGFGDLVVDTTTIEAAPQYGLKLRLAGVNVALSSIAIAGNTITAQLPAPATPGASYEFSHCCYGPGSAYATHSGVWANFKRQGPRSNIITEGPGKTVDNWLAASKHTVVAT